MRAMPTRRILLKTTAKLAASSAFALNRPRWRARTCWGMRLPERYLKSMSS
jgi:hypothetical protein